MVWHFVRHPVYSFRILIVSGLMFLSVPKFLRHRSLWFLLPWVTNITYVNYWDHLCFLKGKGKGKVFPVNAMKACRGTRKITPLLPNLGTRWWWVVYLTPWTILSWYPLNMRFGGPAQLICVFWRREKYPCRYSNLGSSLCRLFYPFNRILEG